MKTVGLLSLGCKVNTYEMEYILSEFKKKGYEITDNIGDIYVINTCSVTNTSDAKSRKIINKVIREKEIKVKNIKWFLIYKNLSKNLIKFLLEKLCKWKKSPSEIK